MNKPDSVNNVSIRSPADVVNVGLTVLLHIFRSHLAS